MQPSPEKAALRRELRTRRQALDPALAEAWSRRIQERVLALDEWRGADTVFLYAAFRAEADTGLLLESAWAAGKRVLLPRCRKDDPGMMDLAFVTGWEQIRPGSFSIPEPDPALCPAVEDPVPDLAAVPGLAWDRLGYRLGYGGGYYDRLLASAGRPPLCLGLAFGLQMVDSLPREPWDQPVDGICTEEELLWTRS